MPTLNGDTHVVGNMNITNTLYAHDVSTNNIYTTTITVGDLVTEQITSISISAQTINGSTSSAQHIYCVDLCASDFVATTDLFATDISVRDTIAAGTISAGVVNALAIHKSNVLLLPPGVILPYCGSTAPDGYLLCTGTNVSRTTYGALYSAIGVTYGVGNGTTTFTLPDLRQRFPLYGVTIGTTGGTDTATLSTNNMPSHSHTGVTATAGSHTHSITDPGHFHGRQNGHDDGNVSNIADQAPPGDSATGLIRGYPTDNATTGITINSGGSHTHTFTTDTTGSGQSFSVQNPYLGLTYIIKY